MTQGRSARIEEPAVESTAPSAGTATDIVMQRAFSRGNPVGGADPTRYRADMHDGLGDAPTASAAHGDRTVPSAVHDLVAALWRAGSAAPSTPDPLVGPAAPDLCTLLGRCAADAEWLATSAPAAERAAARLVAETARAACAAVGGRGEPPSGQTANASVLPSLVRRRLARMERWLADRAAADPAAEPAANLCLWVLDCLEGDAP